MNTLVNELKKCEETARDSRGCGCQSHSHLSSHSFQTVIINCWLLCLLSSFSVDGVSGSRLSLYSRLYSLFLALKPLPPTICVCKMTNVFVHVPCHRPCFSWNQGNIVFSLDNLQLIEDVPVQSPTILTPEECLSQLDIRVGRVVEAWNHPDSDKYVWTLFFPLDWFVSE